jgi:hypothetical protein
MVPESNYPGEDQTVFLGRVRLYLHIRFLARTLDIDFDRSTEFAGCCNDIYHLHILVMGM